jgi:hypothetical protein
VSKFTVADVDYIRANFLTLEELCGNRPESPAHVEALINARCLPRPSYVLDDGTAMFPDDYFRLLDEAVGVEALREHFAARHRAATERQSSPADELERDWEAYLDGTYGICLRAVTPEAIVRKTALVLSVCELRMLPRSRKMEWRRALREQVDALDALEREFTPDYDRADEHDRPPTRDLLVNVAHERYPDVFAPAATESLADVR